MRILRTILSCYFLVAIISAHQSVAQTLFDDARIEMLKLELTHTERLIQQVSEAIYTTDNPLAILTLDKAKEIQSRAREAFREQTDIGYKTAGLLTMKARELAKSALSNSRQANQFEAQVAKKLERSENLLRRARETINEDSPQLMALFESARNNLHRGREFFRNHRFRPAVKLADQVEKMARKILSARSGSKSGRVQFERRKETIGERIRNLRNELSQCKSIRAQELIEQAEKVYRQADKFGEKEKWGKGLRLLQKARKFAQQAIHDCEGSQRLRQNLQHLEALAARIAESLPNLNANIREVVARLLNQSKDQLRLAADFISEENLDAARASLRGAQITLRQANKQSGATD